MVIVASAAEPDLKPHLIDRFLVAAEQAQIDPVICINKVDLVEPGSLQPLVGVYAQMGYEVLQVSAVSGLNLPILCDTLQDCASVVVGQSGVGKSSLLNVVEPGLGLRVGLVSRETQKGRHTTTTARLIELSTGGFIVDTPGIRQFALWDVVREEVAGLFRDIRPFVGYCRFPDCTHTHEADCAVKASVADGRLDARRYESYCHMRRDGEA
jgi:ribosome biogenesis GTPase